jgi:hypothetical protein
MAGEVVQYQEDGQWRDMEPYATCEKLPHFYRTGIYRMKPVTHRFRVGEDRHLGPVMATSLEAETRLSKAPSFMGWLTDWQEVTR